MCARKSQIAIEYAHQYRENHPQSHVFWVYAANATLFVQAYQDIARQLKLPGSEDAQLDTCQLVSNWLDEADGGGWLIIVDNADDTGLFLHDTVVETSNSPRAVVDYLPKQLDAKRCMIVTTRSQDIGEALAHGEPCINVGPFSVEEGRELLQSKVRRAANRADEPAIGKLVEMLGRIPLAITQAAAYMNRNSISVPRYVAALEKDNQNLIDHLSKELQDHRRERGYPNSVFRTWRLSFEQIRLHDAHAAELLSLMAMLDGQQIPQDLVQRPDKKEVDFSSALGTLAGYSLVASIGDEVWTIHPLVQLSVQDWLAAMDQKTNVEEEALRLVAGKFPSGEHKNRATCEALLPHARAVLQRTSRLDSCIRDYASLLYNVGWFDWQQGRYSAAKDSAKAAYDISLEVLGGKDILTINSLGLYGTVLADQGKHKQAEEIDRQVLRLRETVQGKEHPDTLTSMNNLALALRGQGKYEQAEEIHRQVTRLRETVLGKEHPDTLTSVYCLAYVLHHQQRLGEADPLYRRALAGYEKILGSDHPETQACRGNYSIMLEGMNDPDTEV
jgi:tetratricopeptide (TPR) repeat protein